MKMVFVRNDDVGTLTKELEQVSTLLCQEDVPVSHAVIPGQLTPDSVSWLQQLLREYPALVEIHQHGWKHRDYGGQGEFGATRSYQEQYQDIYQGKMVLQHYFGERFSPCFTPPWHRYTGDTLQVLAILGFSGFSTKHTHQIPMAGQYPFQIVPIHLNVLQRSQEGWAVKREEELQGEWRNLASYASPLGILLHHEHFRTREALRILRRFLLFLKEEGVVFCKLNDVVTQRMDSWSAINKPKS
jgi:peptidoglycan/xylan/chitin deacetylase (PgdA/CDA1 family)